MNHETKKLSLNAETLRALSDQDVQEVAGGRAPECSVWNETSCSSISWGGLSC